MLKYLFQLSRLLVFVFQRLLYIFSLSHFPPPFSSASVFLSRQNEVLLIKRKDGNGLCLPGGYMRLWESAQETAIREAKEETGLDIEPKEVITILSGKRWNMKVACTDIVFRAEIKDHVQTHDSFEGACVWRALSGIKREEMAFDYFAVIELMK